MASRRSGLWVFGTVLGCHLALTLVGLFLMVGGGLGPDVQATTLNRVGSALLGALLFPLEAIHGRFFLGRSLPGNDWLWIIGVGAAYAGVAVGGVALVRRARGR